MRAEHDAVLTGIGTVRADDPAFTARPEGGCDRQPDLIVMGDKETLEHQMRIFEDPTRQVVFRTDRDLARATEGYNTVMIEAGARIAAAAIRAGIVDQIEWFRAPIMIGENGLSVIAELGLDMLSAAPKFKRVAVKSRGDDLQESYERIR